MRVKLKFCVTLMLFLYNSVVFSRVVNYSYSVDATDKTHSIYLKPAEELTININIKNTFLSKCYVTINNTDLNDFGLTYTDTELSPDQTVTPQLILPYDKHSSWLADATVEFAAYTYNEASQSYMETPNILKFKFNVYTDGTPPTTIVSVKNTSSGLNSATFKIDGGSDDNIDRYEYSVNGGAYVNNSTSNEFTISNLQSCLDEYYLIAVKAVDKAGNVTSFSGNVHVKTNDPTPATLTFNTNKSAADLREKALSIIYLQTGFVFNSLQANKTAVLSIGSQCSSSLKSSVFIDESEESSALLEVQDNKSEYFNIENAPSFTSNSFLTYEQLQNTDVPKVITLFPNPTSGIVTISGIKSTSTIVVTNNKGVTVYSNTNVVDDIEIDLSDNPTGVYYLTVNNEEGVYFDKINIGEK